MSSNRTTQRALQILCLLAKRPDGMTLSEISLELEMPKTSAFDILQTLRQEHFLRETHKRFSIGYMAHEVGRSYQPDRDLYDVWNSLCQRIEKSYEMELLWNRGGKAWTYEYKYRKGGKTLCALYAKEKTLGFMVILGKDERAKFEIQRGQFSNEVQMIYDAATTFHDGKWIMFELKDTKLFNDMERLLLIKRKPNRKAE